MFSHLCQLSTSPRCFIIVLIYGIRTGAKSGGKIKEGAEVIMSTMRRGVKDALVKFLGKGK